MRSEREVGACRREVESRRPSECQASRDRRRDVQSRRERERDESTTQRCGEIVSVSLAVGVVE